MPFIHRFARLVIILLALYCVTCTVKYSLPGYTSITITDLRPVVVSEKIGDTIDLIERDQFNLFPGINSFESAQIFVLSDSTGGFIIELTSIYGKKHHSINRDPHGLEIMGDYIDNYENIIATRDSLMRSRKIIENVYRGFHKEPVYEKVKDPFETKWHIINYDAMGLPITHEEVAIYHRKHANILTHSGCCCLATGTAGILMILAAGFSYGTFGMPSFELSGPIVSISIMGTIAGTIYGAVQGNNADVVETINAIKAGRQLKLVE